MQARRLRYGHLTHDYFSSRHIIINRTRSRQSHLPSPVKSYSGPRPRICESRRA
jgi:hypothetical protein